MVRNVVSVLQEVLHQEQSPIDTPDTIAESSNHVPNEVKTTQHQLAAQLQQTRKMMQATQTQYAAAPHLTHQYYVGRGYYRGQNNYQGQGVHEAQCRVNWIGGSGERVYSDLTH